MHIVGTAGHVDHGKSSLVLSLTGTNPDRWAEERLRGMTLDLGFAHLDLGGVEAGIIDVPGHERFLHNMLAGAAGMELLLLVIAADEGAKPQTVEHLQILRYLDVQRVLVVATKIDTLEDADVEAALANIRESLRGTIAEDSPMFGVSNLTGSGIDELRAGIREALLQLPSRNADAPAYLPVDRVFALQGLGTVVTGTLMQGVIATGDRLVLQPENREVRVRSVHTFNTKIDRADAGMRVALNLPGIDRADAKRGDAVCAPELVARNTFAVRFTPLADALPILRRRNTVRAYIGSAEILGTLVFEVVPHSTDAIDATLHLRADVVALQNAPFVVRRLSPKTLLGGGRIAGVESTAAPANDDVDDRDISVLEVLRKTGLAPLTASEVAERANLREAFVTEALERLQARGDVVQLVRPVAYLAMVNARPFFERVYAFLLGSEEREPWALGCTSLLLSRAFEMPEPLIVRMIGAFAEEGRLANRGGYYSTVEFSPRLTAEQQTFFDTLVAPVDGFVPVPFDEVVARVKRTQLGGVSRAFDMLIGRGIFVKVGDQLYRGTQIRSIHLAVDRFLRQNGRMTMAEFRDLIGTSRKYAVPLLEWFDSRGITVRSGDFRMLRKREKASAG